MIEDNNPQRLGDRIDARDNAIIDWAKLTKKMLLQKLISLGVTNKIKLARTVTRIRVRKGKGGSSIQKEPFLTKSLAHRLRRKDGELESVAFSFVRHGIFLERGVGYKRPAGSSGANATAKPWIEPILPNQIEVLATILAENYADIAAEELRILVPGVIDTKVKV